MSVYQILAYVGLVFVLIFHSVFGPLIPEITTVHTVPENGSLTAVDALGRTTVSAGQSDKKVGVFYFLWSGEHSTDGPYDITGITEKDPEAYRSDERWKAAGGGSYAGWHHWGEPLFGYYLQTDRWVVSRHCQMLTDAGVDFIVFDTTNAFTYSERVRELIDVWYGYWQQGFAVPQLAFYTNSYSGDTMNRIYDEIYQNSELRAKYPELDRLWFRLNGKPMIVGDPSDPALRQDVKDFFRIKANQWPVEAPKSDGFPWMEFGQIGKIFSYYKNSPRDASIMSVSAAQHCDTCRFSASAWYGANDHGRSWHDGAKDTSENAVLYGYNFAEQWDYAIKLDPDIVFVTGFNEWTAQRLNAEDEPIMFVDNCNEEYSRDVEPAAGVLGDNYYMQLVNYIAKFKGSRDVVASGDSVTIDVDGSFDQWKNSAITSVYRDYRDDVFDRNSRGFGALYYTDDSGRNDIVTAKVTQDAEYLYFYVDTAQALTPSTDQTWMTLFLNLNGTKEGYDFCVNRTSPSEGKTTVEAINGSEYTVKGTADIRFSGNQLMLTVPKALLGLTAEQTSFSFKWADNYTDGDVMSFYTKGDCAPYGRMNYVFGG